jgi:hypothetical protein
MNQCRNGCGKARIIGAKKIKASNIFNGLPVVFQYWTGGLKYPGQPPDASLSLITPWRQHD